MRRIVAICGALLTAMIILISGSAVATWHYGLNVYDYYQCTDPNLILGSPDGDNATIGVDTPYYRPGWIIVDLGVKYGMGPDQNFTVFASSRVEELYNVYVGENYWDFIRVSGEGGENDTMNHVFTTPSDAGKIWRYINITGVSGSYDLDSHWGPEIDAVGWEA